MKKIILFPALLGLPLLAIAQWPSSVTIVESKANDSVTVSGDLSSGAQMQDLSWAANSTNACFVSIQNSKYRGNHVFFATTIPPHSIIHITVIPEDTAANFSMYAYMLSKQRYDLVPDLPNCITCEADFKWDRPVKNRVQNSERKVQISNPTNNTYSILIGVSSPKGMMQTKFNLQVYLKS